MNPIRPARRIATSMPSLGALAALLLNTFACSQGPAAGGSDPSAGPTGQVSLPLVTHVGDSTYRLAGVYLQIWGPRFAILTSSDDPNETFLSTSLPTGNYTAYLNGWQLQKDDGSGQFVRVEAQLASPAQVSVVVFNGSVSTITYQFQTDGVVVRMGTGQVRVVAEVSEIPSTCTPFVGGCGDGAWCPPAGLTGAPLACLPAGPIAVGQPCGGPSDCSPNASCVDPGTGEPPVCRSLCPPSLFGAACDDGGACTEVAPDYGVCTP
jgi:hypothetical protein